MTATAQAVLNVARSQIGTLEVPVNRTKYGAWYGWNGVSWCDEFISWCAAQAGAGDIIWRSASVPTRLSIAHQRALTVANPQPGDLACFDWNSDRVADHIGIVEHVLGDGRIQTIEGNTAQSHQGSGGVWRMNRWVGNVIGWIRPHYATPVIVRPAPSPTSGTRPLVIDGQWGPLTTKHLQMLLRLTPIDGVFGPRTIRAMQRWLLQPTTGSVDGSSNIRTRTALQHRVGATADGVIGPLTIRDLQRYLNRTVT